MLEKIPRYCLHQLRVIHPVDADLNILLLILWVAALRHYTGGHLRAFGDKQVMRLLALVLFKRFTYPMMDLTKTDGATFDNGAKACFDRIIPALTSLRGRPLGMPRSACHLCIDFLFDASVFSRRGQASLQPSSIHFDGEGKCTRWAPAVWLS
jgi:hypothetical protein